MKCSYAGCNMPVTKEVQISGLGSTKPFCTFHAMQFHNQSGIRSTIFNENHRSSSVSWNERYIGENELE